METDNENEKLKEEVKLLKQENQRLQKIVEQIKTWVPPGFHMQLGIVDKKENQKGGEAVLLVALNKGGVWL